MIDLQIVGTFPRPGKWNWSFGIRFFRKFSGNLLGTKKSNILPNICVDIFLKLTHYFSYFSECKPISDINPKHTDHCFHFFSNQTWSITNITRMPPWYWVLLGPRRPWKGPFWPKCPKYCVVLHCILLHGIVLHLIICYGIAWYLLWYCMVFYCFAWYCIDYTVLLG